MDFSGLKAEELIDLLPPLHEDDKWEWKSAAWLSGEKRCDLKKFLGKHVSAFANSGGGYLVLGVSDKERALEPCEKQVKRQPMKAFLVNKCLDAVDPPVSDLRVHELVSAANPDESIFVVEIGDSQLAPHQSVVERIYFHRTDGDSRPAVHHYLELVRNRQIAVRLEVNDFDITVKQDRSREPDPNWNFYAELRVQVTNNSNVVAEPCGMIVKLPKSSRWRFTANGKLVQHVYDTPPRIFPTVTTELVVSAFFITGKSSAPNAIHDRFHDLEFSFQLFTQNFASELTVASLSEERLVNLREKLSQGSA